MIPVHCRFQVCLPTPLAPISAFVAPEHQAAIEPLYEARLLEELETILGAIPHDQLAIQWDTNFEFAMLDGVLPLVRRRPRRHRRAPAAHRPGRARGRRARLPPLLRPRPAALRPALRRPATGRHRQRPVGQPRAGRSTGSTCPSPVTGSTSRYFEKLALLALRPETDLYLGLVHLADGEVGAHARVVAAHRYLKRFGVATECGWGRHRPQDVDRLIQLHLATSAPGGAAGPARQAFSWPDGFDASPMRTGSTAPWTPSASPTTTSRATAGTATSTPRSKSWPRPLRDGDILLDYSGGTGILLDRLELRLFDAQVGTLIVDSSPKFLRVALEKFRDDPKVALRLLRFLATSAGSNGSTRCSAPAWLPGASTSIASTNAIHLYPDLADMPPAGRGSSGPAGRCWSTRATSATPGPASASGSSTRRCGSWPTWPRASCAATAPTPLPGRWRTSTA